MGGYETSSGMADVSVKHYSNWEFPGGPRVRTPHSHAEGPSSVHGQGPINKITQALQHGQKKKKKSIATSVFYGFSSATDSV